MNEKPDAMHGRLLEAVHISGYSFERACKELEWLLEENRWKQCGKGFDNIDDFLLTIDFSDFKIPNPDIHFLVQLFQSEPVYPV